MGFKKRLSGRFWPFDLVPIGKDFPMPSKTHADALTLAVGSGKENSNSSGGW